MPKAKKQPTTPPVPPKKRGKSTRKPAGTGTTVPVSTKTRVKARTALNKHKIVELFVEGLSVREIATRLDKQYTYGTVKQIIAQPEFRKLLDSVLAARREAIGNRLEFMAAKALDVHDEIMDDRTHRRRLDAAEGVLDRIGATQKGSLVRQEVNHRNDDFSGRSKEDLEYYVKNGHFPEDAPDEGKKKASK
jgi:hypothetical protein